MLKLTIGSYVSVRSSRYKARGKFGEHERGKCLLTSGAQMGIWSTLAQLNLIRQIYGLCYNSYWPMLKVGSIRMGWLRLSEQENFTRSLHIMSVPRTHKLHIFMKQDYFLVFVWSGTQPDLQRDPYLVLNELEHPTLVSGIGALPLLTLLQLVLRSYWIQRWRPVMEAFLLADLLSPARYFLLWGRW